MLVVRRAGTRTPNVVLRKVREYLHTFLAMQAKLTLGRRSDKQIMGLEVLPIALGDEAVLMYHVLC